MKEGEFRIPSGCAIAALIHKDKHRENGERITQAMQMMHERSNGLGGGFAAYGIYPEHKNEYALHLFYHISSRQWMFLIFHGFQFSSHIPRPTVAEGPGIWQEN